MLGFSRLLYCCFNEGIDEELVKRMYSITARTDVCVLPKCEDVSRIMKSCRRKKALRWLAVTRGTRIRYLQGSSAAGPS